MLVVFIGTAELDIDKVDLELLVGLDADQDGRTAASDYDLIGVVDRFEDECERALLQIETVSEAQDFERPIAKTDQFHDDALDQSNERDLFAVLRVVKVFGKYDRDFGIRVGLELVSSLLQDETELLVCSQS